MSSRSKISEFIQKQVHQRAKCLCEYCHASEQWQYVQFTVDHIMPLSLGGTDNLENSGVGLLSLQSQEDKSADSN
ncbi:HNH endonuclease [Nostoc sp.]|uniref:HNH endonuclease n=1 Tax=Nostoc sp. TaxID=1180 RepID=UPI002FFBFEB4